MAELKKFGQFLAISLLFEAILLGIAWAFHQSQGGTLANFGSVLGVMGGVAMLLGLFSLIGGIDSFKKLKRAINPMGAKKIKDEEIKSPDFNFFLMMLLVGSVAIGVGKILQKG